MGIVLQLLFLFRVLEDNEFKQWQQQRLVPEFFALITLGLLLVYLCNFFLS